MGADGIVIETVLVKLASRCNLDCSYCYVYRMGDEGWRRQPKRIAPATVRDLAERLSELVVAQDRSLGVVFHGGEPLLIGATRFDEVCRTMRENLPPDCSLALQTNGLLLDDDIVRICLRFDVGVSVSVDGPAATHDRHRVDHGRRPTHAGVTRALARLTASAETRSIFSGVLAVVDLASDPVEVYSALKDTGAPSIDFLYRDGHHDALPLGKGSPLSTEYGDWMCRLLDHYLSDRRPTPVRVLDDMLRLLLGGWARKEGLGTTDYGILVIETDGTICKNDTLKSAFDGADVFDAKPSIRETDLRTLVGSESYRAYHAGQRPTSATCLMCPELAICGGGMPAHRWSASDGFGNPSVFCADQLRLIDHMRIHLRRMKLAV